MEPSTGKVCSVCGREDRLISPSIGVCAQCIRTRGKNVLDQAFETHRTSRRGFGLAPTVPKASKGIPCKVCSNECVLAPGDSGYCGLRLNESGRLVSLTRPNRGVYYTYLDPHVTNCCAAWFCPAGTGVGYPEFARCRGPEYGYYNLAVFFYGCSFDCLFCQNYSHKRIHEARPQDADILAQATLGNERISCWCFFGGSPEPQLPFAIEASRMALESLEGTRVMRICFEWNGCGNLHLVKRAGELALKSGGNIKFDLKCWDENLSYALSGVSNRRSYENFRLIAEEFHKARRTPPLLTATTLLVPGYVDEVEVENVARFISELDETIPYSLLVFHPDYMLRDLPVTTLIQVEACKKAAKMYLENVNIGNIHLL